MISDYGPVVYRLLYTAGSRVNRVRPQLQTVRKSRQVHFLSFATRKVFIQNRTKIVDG